jgi:hypothetical protein
VAVAVAVAVAGCAVPAVLNPNTALQCADPIVHSVYAALGAFIFCAYMVNGIEDSTAVWEFMGYDN